MKKNRYGVKGQVVVVLATITLFVMGAEVVGLPHGIAHAHTSSQATATKSIDNYQVAFQLYPKFTSAGQNATLHFSLFDEKNSTINGVQAAMIMKEKKSGRIVDQIPYRFYEFGDISIPYRFHENEDYVATLLTRIEGDSKYMVSPLAVDFVIPVRQTTIMSPNDLLLMVVPFTAALAGGFAILFRRKK